ncbi:MAG: hypothetical protein ACKVRO_04865 [Micropepsaceae bacterium]
MKTYTSASLNGNRATKEGVPATVYMTDGTALSGDLYIFKTGQRLQDLLNDGSRQFLPLRMSDGRLTFINRDFMKMISEAE